MSAASDVGSAVGTARDKVQGSGLLAIWNDCVPDWLEAYEDWYQREHLPERLSIPGFLRGRRYEALTPGPRFLTCYDVVEPGILSTEAYRARIDAPTQATAEMMRFAFRNMSRTICRRETFRDGPYGGCCVTLLVDDAKTWCADIGGLGDFTVSRVDLWTAEDDGAAPSTEEDLRGGDERIRAGIHLEVPRPDGARCLAEAIGGQAFQLISEMYAPDTEVRP